MSIRDLLPIGSRNAIKRKDLLYMCKAHGIANNDREMRRLIEEARQDLCIVCLSDGKGYFIPDNDDKDKLRHYIAQERDRIKSVAKNLGVATRIAKAVIEGGCVPIVPHLYITEVLNDDNPAERELGMKICLELVERCNFMFVGQRYGITDGMKQEIAKAKLCNKLIMYMG